MENETPGMDTPEVNTPDLGDSPALGGTPLGEYENEIEGDVNSQARIAVIGDQNVGKTCLLMAYRPSVKDEIPSIFNAIHIEKDIHLNGYDTPLKLTLCDSGALPQYFQLRQKAYKNVDIILVCFDVMNMASLQSIDTHWIQEIKEFAPHAVLTLTGLKSDLRSMEENENEVSPDIINTYIERYDFVDYIETSALKKHNVDIAFEVSIQEFILSHGKHRKTTDAVPEESPDIDPDDIVGTHQYQWGQHLRSIEETGDIFVEDGDIFVEDADIFATLTNKNHLNPNIEYDAPHSMHHNMQQRPLMGSHMGPQSMLNAHNGGHLLPASPYHQQPMSWGGPSNSRLGCAQPQYQFPSQQQQHFQAPHPQHQRQPSPQQPPSPVPQHPHPQHQQQYSPHTQPQQQQQYSPHTQPQPQQQYSPHTQPQPQQQYSPHTQPQQQQQYSPHTQPQPQQQYSPHTQPQPQQQYSPHTQPQGYHPQQHSPIPQPQPQQQQGYAQLPLQQQQQQYMAPQMAPQNYVSVNQQPLRQQNIMQQVVPIPPTPPPEEQRELKYTNKPPSVQYNVRKHDSVERTGSIDYAMGKRNDTSTEDGSCQCCIVM